MDTVGKTVFTEDSQPGFPLGEIVKICPGKPAGTFTQTEPFHI